MRRAAVALALLLTVSAASAAETTAWHVVKRGETLETLALKYLGDSQEWPRLWKLNPQVKDPQRIYPGQRLMIPLPQSLPARSAEIRTVARHVEKKPEPRPWEPARPGDRLAERHGVQTFERSSAELRFDDNTSLTLTERSLVFLRSMRALGAKRDRSEIEIVDGQGDLEKPAAAKRANDIEITIGGAKAKPAAGEARARFRSANRTAAVSSYRGATAVTSAGASVKVPEGSGVVVPEGAAPPPPQKLLPAPKLARLQVSTARPKLEWPAVAGAASYSLEICRDRLCGEVVTRAEGLTGTAWQPDEPLPAGAMFWRVTPRSAASLDGYPALAPFTVQHAISGRIVTDGQPSARVNVILYRDGTPVAKTATSAAGAYLFAGLGPGQYHVVVDSRSIAPAGAWAEQLEGPAGALCGGRTLEAAGGCAGGKSEAGDDASAFERAEHVARVELGDFPVEGIDFTFSHDAVTSTADAGQGTLRQFLENANALPGANRMFFAPVAAPQRENEWTVRLASPLPPLRDGGTVIDGRAHDPFALARELPAAEQRGTVTRVGAGDFALQNPDGPTLRLDFAGAAVGIDAQAAATIRNVRLTGARLQLRAAGGLRLENSVVGVLLERAQDSAGVEINGPAEIRRTIVTGYSGPCVAVRGEGQLVAEHLEVSGCAWAADAVAAVVLGERESKISMSHFLLNTAAPAVRSLGLRDVIEESTFRGNRVAIAVARDSALLVRGNLFLDNMVAAVVADGRSPEITGVTVDAQQMMRVRGRAGQGSRRVEVLGPGSVEGFVTLAAAEAGDDGTFEIVLPAGSR